MIWEPVARALLWIALFCDADELARPAPIIISGAARTRGIEYR